MLAIEEYRTIAVGGLYQQFLTLCTSSSGARQ